MSFSHRELRALVAIADAGTLGMAAGRVHLSQPALSRLIKTVEDRLGGPLFERSRYGMVPTVFGEALLPYARMLLFEMEQAVDAVDAARGMRRGTLRLGAVATIIRSILPQALERLHAEFPAIKTELLDAPEDRLLAALEGRSIDIMIAGALPPHEEIICVAECRFDDSYTVFCASQNRFASEEAISLDEALLLPWVATPPNSAPRTLFEETLRGLNRLPPTIVIETLSPSSIVAIVRETDFLGWLPRPLFASEEAAGVVRTLDIAGLCVPRRFFVYRRRRGLFPPIARSFIEVLPLAG